MDKWRIALMDHPDTTLVDHIEFGFPSNYSTPTFTNHKEDPAYAYYFALRTLCPDIFAGLDLIVNTDNAASTHAFTITIRHKTSSSRMP